jgi:HEAT repeat protein
VSLDPHVVSLIRALKSPSPSIRENAAMALGNTGARAVDAVPELAEGLSDVDPDVRRWALWALGQIGVGARSAANAIEPFTRSEDVAIRELARTTMERVAGTWKKNVWRV